MLLIDDDTYQDYYNHVLPNGGMAAKGCIPRNFDSHPVGCYAAAPEMKSVNIPLIDPSEYSDRIKEKVATKSQLSDVRMQGNFGNLIPSLDQNDGNGHWGFCWSHSSTMAVMLERAMQGLPYVPLSAFAVACIIKNYQDQGGWGAQSLEFIGSRGVPSQQYWPQKNLDRANDNSKTWENAALHKVTSGWVDLDSPVYDRHLTFNQVATLLLSNTPVVGDFNWWGHSICLMDLVEVEPGSFGVRFINSWADSYGELGTAVLRGSKAIPDSAVAPRTVRASVL